MQLVFDDERTNDAPRLVFDDEKSPEKQPTALSTTGDYLSAINTGIAKGVGGIQGFAGTVIQDPAAAALSALTGGAALADRGVTWAINNATPFDAKVNPDIQETAQQVSQFAQERRDLAVAEPYNLPAKFGKLLETDGRRIARENTAAEKAGNPELVRQQRAMSEAEGFVGNVKAAVDNPLAFTNTMAQSLPDMLMGMGLGRATAKSVLAGAEVAGQRAAATAAAAGADAAAQAAAAKLAVEAVGKQAIAKAGTVGLLSEASSSAGQGREGTYNLVAAMPLTQLEASPRFREIKSQTGDGLQARQILANELADQVPLLAGMGTAAGTLITNKLFGGDATAKSLAGVDRMTGREFGKRVLQDTVEEGFQGVPEDAVQHGAQVQADPSQKYDPAGSLAQNMMAGLAMGAGGHGAAFARENMTPLSGPAPTQPVIPPNTPIAPAATAQAATNSIASTPDTSAAEAALLTPVTLTALDRVNEIDGELGPVRERLAVLTADASGSSAVGQELLDATAQSAALEQERSALSKDWPKSVTGMPSSFTTEAGARVEAQYALMDAADLITSHDEGLRKNPLYPPELQPRERERAASEIQVAAINQKLDPARLGWSADAATGAPIVGADGLVESGNARTIALKRVYQIEDGKGDDGRGSKAHLYREYLKDNAAQFGITPEAVDGMAKPVLVRVRSTPVNRAEFARQANASTVAAMAPSEQAKSDSNRIDSMEDLAPDDSGDFSNAASRPFVRRFMARLPITEQAGMIDANGDLSTTGYARVRNAVLAKAYGDSPVLARMTESMDDNLRNVSKAMMMAAPKVAQMRSAVSAGNRFDADITPDLMAAVEELSRLKDDGGSVQDALAQTDLMGDQRSPEASQLLQFLSDNMRRPRRMADFIGAYMDALDAAGDPNQGSLLGETQAPAKKDLLTAAEKATKNEVQDGGSKGAGTAQKAGDQTQRQSEDAQSGSGSDQANGGGHGPGKNTDTAGQPSEGWVDFPPESGAMGIPRAKMPQVKADKRPALYDFLMAKGITHTRSFVKPGALKPTQAEYSPAKAENAKALDGQKAVVLASSDGYILDGHHRWVSRADLGEMVDVIKFSAPMGKLLEAVREFPGVTTSSESAQAPVTPEAAAPNEPPAARAEYVALAKEALGELAAIASKHTRMMMLPEDTPGLMPALVKLFSAAIKIAGSDMKAATKWVKAQLKADPRLQSFWQLISNETYQKAALQAFENPVAPDQSEMFEKPVAGEDQSSLFGEAPEAKNPTALQDKKQDLAPVETAQEAIKTVAKTAKEQAPAAQESVSAKTQPKPAKIEDSGEVLEGARKLYAKNYASKLEEGAGMDTAAVPLSKSWPEPDYQRLIDEGADPWAVAMARAMRDEVPTKPSSWSLKGWVQKVEALRDMAADVMSGAMTQEKFKATGGQFNLADWFNKIDLYEAVGHAKSLKALKFSMGEYGMYGGQTFKPAKKLWTINQPSTSSRGNWGNDLVVADTKEEAIEKFKAWSEAQEDKAPAEVRATSFDIYTYRSKPGVVIVGKRISGTKSIDLKEFPTVKEAREYKTANQAELEKLLAEAKFEPAERRESNSPRVGVDHRNGADVTSEQFRETFGFRGEQFGSSMPQGERQANMNQAYDALMDLAGVVGVPPKALSLNGELGLAFGARGTGGKNPAAAHYERDTTGAVTPNRVVINLTRKNGAGSLAHEWFHAVDNYFARMRGEKAGMLTESHKSRGEGVRPEVVDAFKRMMNIITLSGINERSKRLDKKRTKDYWSTGLEMAARSFESYVIAKLQDQNKSNDYLANVVDEELYGIQNSYPYPSMGEMPAIREVFDHFFDTVQTKETEQGMAMFSRSGRVDVSDPHTGISSALLELGKLDSLYQYPKSDKIDLEGIAADKSMTVGDVDRNTSDGKLWMIANTTPDDAPGVQSWIVTLPGGQHATLTDKRGEVYINVSAVGEGNGGSRVYDLAANYAFNNGLKFIGDPNGVSSAAMRRRLENMLSAAIKYGSTDFLAPHADQIEGNDSIGVPALKWTDGDTLGNIRSMVDVSVASTKSTNPVATKDVRFDAATQSLRDGGDNLVDARRLSEMLGDEGRTRGTGQAGYTTLRRNALFKSLLQSVGNRTALMEFIHPEQDSGSANAGGALEGSFYSRGSASSGLSAQSVQDITDPIKSRWANAPEIVVAANMADPAIPQAVRDYDQKQKSLGATGEPEGFIHKGKVYLVADQLVTPSDVIRVLFHESLGHIGLRGAFGNSMKPILQQIVAARKAEVAAKASHYGLDMGKEADRLVAAEEVLAEMAQTKPELGFVKRSVAAIRNWLRANVPGFQSMKMTDADIIEQFILPARAFVERGRGGAAGAVALSRGADAKDQTDTPAFKKWFGDSKVVDDEGKPLVVYHGSKTAGITEFNTSAENNGGERGTFFSAKKSATEDYGSSVYESYLSIKNPYEVTSKQWSMGEGMTPVEARGASHDGYIIRGLDGKDGDAFIAFKPTQIKSATGNNGDFDTSNPDIRFSRNSLGQTPAPVDPKDASPLQKAKAKALSLTSPQALDQLMYDYTDKYIDLKRIRDHIKAIGGTITDLNDAYLGEELYHKRLSKRTEDFLSSEVQPLLADLRARGVGTEAFEEFLHARHAPEANKAMAARNPTQAEIDTGKASAEAVVKALEVQLQGAKTRGAATLAIEKSLVLAREEGYKWVGAQAFKGTEEERLSLSGMTDAKAQAVMDGLTPAQLKNMNALAARVDAINAKTMDTLGQYGLMDQESLGEWRKAYQFYIPLHRDEAHPDSTSHPIGQGFSVKGDAAKRRTGSNAKVSNILGHIAMQREAALTRGEKNTVVKKLYVMAAQNPDADLWSVEGVPTITQIDKKSGFAHTYPDPMYKNKPNVVMVRIAGKDAAIVFNERNPQGVRLAGAMKNIDVGDLGAILTQTARVTRLFSAVNTQWNPIFGLVNFARDIQAAMLNLSTTPLSGQQAKVAKGVPSALRAVYRVERGKTPSSAEGAKWAALWEDLQEVGGTTGYRDMYSDASDRMTALLKDLQKLDRGQVSQAAHAVVDWLSDYNDAIENGVRLSAYSAALDQGMSRERAASLAKNLTVNFNRKGAKAREIGALYAFFNAAIQGNARMFETLRGPVGKKIMFGGVALGMITSMLGMAVMGGGDGEDDEWAGIPEFVKERAIVIPLGHQDYMAIPLPLGFHVFPNFGRLLAEWAMGGPDKSLGKQVGKVLGSLVDSFNPVGGGSDIGQVIMPTVMDPLLALWRNKDWTGRPIYREDGNSMDPTPGFTRAKDSASTPGKLFAELINWISGGNEYRPGAWSPTPDQLDYVVGQVTGGLGRELLKVNQVITTPFTGDELPAYKVPVLGRFYGNTRGSGAQSGAFYENVRELNEVENEVKGRNKNDGDADGYMASEPLTNLIGDGNSQEKIVSNLRKQRKQEMRDEEPGYKDRVKEINTQIEEEMRVLNRAVKQVKSGVGVG